MDMGTNRSSYRPFRAVFAVLSGCTLIFYGCLYKWYSPLWRIHNEAAYQMVEIVSRPRGGVVQIPKGRMGETGH